MKNFFSTKLNLALFLCMMICVSNTLMSKNQIKPSNDQTSLKNNNKSKNQAIDDKVKGHLRKHLKISHTSKHLDARITLEVLNKMKSKFTEPLPTKRDNSNKQTLKKVNTDTQPLKKENTKTQSLKNTPIKRDGDGVQPVGEDLDNSRDGTTVEGSGDKNTQIIPVESVPCVVNKDGTRDPVNCQTTEEKEAAKCVVNEDGTRNPVDCITTEEMVAAKEKEKEAAKPNYVPTEEEQKKLDAEWLITNPDDKTNLGKHTYQPVETVRKVSSAAQHLFDDKKNPMFEFVVNPGWEQPKIYRGVVGEMNTSVIVNKQNRQEYMRSSDNKNAENLENDNGDE
jgi:hypothetical protein